MAQEREPWQTLFKRPENVDHLSVKDMDLSAIRLEQRVE
jgi:hypothetical protein